MMPSSNDMPDLDRACGERLRQAREKAGLGIEEVAARLKMPARVIESLETGDWQHRDAPVFVRGQLRSYARLLGVRLDAELPATTQVPIVPTELKPMTYTPPMRRMADKLMGRMVYIVITGLIAVPVWMAARSQLQVPAQIAASLDLPASAGGGASSAPNPQPPANERRQHPRTLIASMAPLPQRQPAQPALSLRFDGDSWVQISGPDGNQIEQGLLKAGERRDYAAGEVGSVVLGNASAVQVLERGHVQDLSAYQRANVARFTVSSDGSLAPVSE